MSDGDGDVDSGNTDVDSGNTDDADDDDNDDSSVISEDDLFEFKDVDLLVSLVIDDDVDTVAVVVAAVFSSSCFNFLTPSSSSSC